MDYQHLLQRIEIEVVDLFEKQTGFALTFHNLVHTRRVVAHAVEIASYHRLNEQERFIVEAAAWFHDTGYLTGPQLDHELRGAGLASEFLRAHLVPAELIIQVQGCIMATRLPQEPSGLLQQVVCDADLYHFGTSELFDRDLLMRCEVEMRLGKQIPDSAWLAATIQLMESHQFQTGFALTHLKPTKQQNLALLKSSLENAGR